MAVKPLKHNGLYRFGNFEFDVEGFGLTRDGAAVSLTPKMFEVLNVLVERRGRIVSKDDLMKTVWSDRFVEEGNLAVTIRQLRKALNDDAHHPKYIETIQRRGYRFIAEVEHIGSSSEKTNFEEEKPLTRKNDNHEHFSSAPLGLAKHAGTSGPQAVVSLADWRHADDEPVAKEAVDPGKAGFGRTKLELVRARSSVARWHKNRTLVAGLIAFVVLGASCYVLYHFFARDSGVETNQTRLTFNGKTKTAAISPDGKFIAYVINNEGVQSLWLKNVATESDIQILSPQERTNLGSVAFSPDGNYIYYGASTKLYRLPLLGGTPTEILPEYTGSVQHNEVSFSPDGNRFTFVQNWSDPVTVSVANADGTNEEAISEGVPAVEFVRSAVWSPDGKTIACVGRTPENTIGIFAVNVENRSVSAVPSPIWNEVYQAVWQPDGKALLVVATGSENEFLPKIWRVSYPGGESQTISDGSNGCDSISLTADGSRILVVRTQQNAHIWIVPGDDTSQAKQLTRGFDRYDGIYHLEWLTNEKLVYGSGVRGKNEIWACDADGENAKQLPVAAKSLDQASKDGIVIFEEDDGKGISLQQHQVDGIIWNRLVTSIPEAQAVFSPDNRWVVFNRFSPFSALWKIPVEGGEPQKLTEKGYAVSPSVSPDRKFIAYYHRKSTGHGSPEIAVMPFEGGDPIRTFETTVRYTELNRKGTNLQWSPDGRSIQYTVFKNGVSNVWRQPIDGLPPVQVTQFTEGRIFTYSYSPDGKRLALSRGTLENDAVLLSNFGN